jgi:hypothetical protein
MWITCSALLLLVRWAVADLPHSDDEYCPRACTCQGDQQAVRVFCNKRGLTSVPVGFSAFTIKL